MPVGRGGAFGVAGAGLIGKFWSILCCSNWAFCKVSSSNSYSCNKCSICCWISGGLELPWNGRITALMRAHRGQKSTGIFFPHLAAYSTFFLTQCQISKSKLPSSGNQGLCSTIVWRQASICWGKTENPWTLSKWWSKVEKWWGFPAVWCMSLYLPTSIGPESLHPKCRMYQAPVLGGHLLGSFNGPEPGGQESTIRKWKKKRG